MKKIKLTQNKYALIDDEDYDNISKYKWHAAFQCGIYYARKSFKINGKWKIIPMHVYLMGQTPKHKKCIDHIDGNGLNNQKNNLRWATTQENGQNRKMNYNNKSGFKGVVWQKNLKKWQAGTFVKGHYMYLGVYNDILKAAKAYKKYAKINFKEFKRI